MPTQKLARTCNLECSDNELVQQALDGDMNGFEMLFDRYNLMLANWAYRILRNRQQVEDVLQFVYLQLFLSLGTLHADKSINAWLFRVVHNRCMDELRRMQPVFFSELKVSEEVDDEFIPFEFMPDPGPLPEEIAEQHELQLRILRAISVLPPRLRSVVFLRYTLQKSFFEIGQILNIPEATAKTYFHRAKPILRATLQLYKDQLASAC
ncbi:MAG: RNA polymerase sigma factor [Ktedonobacteraceae bacterium]